MSVVGQPAAITRRLTVEDRVEVWYYGPRVLNEASITTGWLPTTALDWYDITEQVDIEAGVEISGKAGYGGKFTSTDSQAALWPTNRPVAIVAQHYDGTAWGPRYCASWGYVTGRLDQSWEKGSGGRITVEFSYMDRWKKINSPAQRFGTRNLAQTGTIRASTPTISNPAEQIGIEYASQKDAAAARCIDSDRDTVAVFDVIAAPAIPAIGETDIPRILRMFSGRTTRTIGAGGECIFFELWCGQNTTPWGTSWINPPQMYNTSAGEGQDTYREDAHAKYSRVDYGDGTFGFQAVYKAGQTQENFVQWIVGTGYAHRPGKISFDIKAGNLYSVGKHVYVQATDNRSVGASGEPPILLTMSQQLQHYSFVIDSTTEYAGFKLMIKTPKGENNAGDVIYEIKNLRMSVGYDNNIYGQLNNYRHPWFGYDDGNGKEGWMRIEWSLDKSGNWRIPADSSIIICDDEAVFSRRFDAGDRTVYQWKNEAPSIFWAAGGFGLPGVGRLKYAMMNNPTNPNDIDTFGPEDTVIESHDFTTYGFTSDQAITRRSPYATGAVTTEDFPQVGISDNFGAGFVTLDLGAYVAPVLEEAIDAAAQVIPVSDADQYFWAGYVWIEGGGGGTEAVWYHGKTERGLSVVQRGYGGSGAKVHPAGASVYQRVDESGLNHGNDKQTGPMIKSVQVVRKGGTPRIKKGAILWSNHPDPGDPSTGVARWENHPDWRLGRRVTDNNDDVITWDSPIQARFLTIVIDEMHPYRGTWSKAKINEVIVPEYLRGGGEGGNWLGHGAQSINDAIGHVLTQHIGIPMAKIVNKVAPVPLNDLPVATAKAQAQLDSIAKRGGLKIWSDPLGYVYIDADPTSPLWDAYSPAWLWQEDDLDQTSLAGTWEEGGRVSQVIVEAIEVGTLRHHTAKYPAVPMPEGEIITINDVVVRSKDEARLLARTTYRDGNARRSTSATAGACPWLLPNQRHATAYPDLDAADDWNGINFSVQSFVTTFKPKGKSGIKAQTSIQLKEVAL